LATCITTHNFSSSAGRPSRKVDDYGKCCDAKEARMGTAEHAVDSLWPVHQLSNEGGISRPPPCHSHHLPGKNQDALPGYSRASGLAVCDLDAHAHDIAGWCGTIRPRHHLSAVLCAFGEANIYHVTIYRPYQAARKTSSGEAGRWFALGSSDETSLKA
jgi:hypothetical protein